MCVLCGEAVDKYGRVLQVEKKYEILAEKRKRSERKSSVEGSVNGWEKKIKFGKILNEEYVEK